MPEKLAINIQILFLSRIACVELGVLFDCLTRHDRDATAVFRIRSRNYVPLFFHRSVREVILIC